MDLAAHHLYRPGVAMCVAISVSASASQLREAIVPHSTTVTIDRSEYHGRLHGFWLGQAIANWTGRQTEGRRKNPPFYTDADWGAEGRGFDFILDQNPWRADDDTDIEYVYMHLTGPAWHATTNATTDSGRLASAYGPGLYLGIE